MKKNIEPIKIQYELFKTRNYKKNKVVLTRLQKALALFSNAQPTLEEKGLINAINFAVRELKNDKY